MIRAQGASRYACAPAPAPYILLRPHAPIPWRSRDVDIERPEATLVVNTQSRRGLALYGRAKQELERQGVTVAEAYPVRDASRIAAVVEEAIGRGRRFIIVGGGDGTISSIASLFAGKDIVLGLLPLGTANNFARGNGIPLDLTGRSGCCPRAAWDRSISAGSISGERSSGEWSSIQAESGQAEPGRRNAFTNAVSIGLSSAIHRGSPDPLKRAFGRAGYFMVALGRMRSSRPFEASWSWTGGEHVQALDIRIANGPFHGGFPALPEASLDSGDLVVRVIPGRRPGHWDKCGCGSCSAARSTRPWSGSTAHARSKSRRIRSSSYPSTARSSPGPRRGSVSCLERCASWSRREAVAVVTREAEGLACFRRVRDPGGWREALPASPAGR